MSHEGVWVLPWPLSRAAASGWAIPWLALLIADVIVTPGCNPPGSCAADLGAPSYWLTGLSLTAVVVPIVLAISPRVGVWFAAAVAFGLSVIDPLGPWWFGLGVAMATCGLAQVWMMARLRRLARESPPDPEPGDETAPGLLSAAQVHGVTPARVWGVWLPVSAVLVAVALAGWHQVRWHDAGSYAHFAGPSSRVVVIDGSVEDLQIPPGAEVVVKGDFSSNSSGGVKLEVWIITKPPSEMTPPEPIDPAWMLGLAIGLVGIALALRTRFGVSSRDQEALVGAAVSQPVRLVPVGSGAAVMMGDRAAAYLVPLHPAGLWPGRADEDQDGASAPGFEDGVTAQVIGAPVDGRVVIVRQGEALAMARLSDPWPWSRIRHPRSWLGRTGSRDEGRDDNDHDSDAPDSEEAVPDPTELPTDVPLL